MARHKTYRDRKDALRLTISLKNYIARQFLQRRSPFLPDIIVFRVARFIFRKAVECFEYIVGVRLYIENTDRELTVFDKSVRTLLEKLIKNKQIVRWECGIQNMHVPSHYVCTAVSGAITDDSGKLVASPGQLSGHGSSTSINTALTIALAEVIERIAVASWSERSLVFATTKELDDYKTSYFLKSFLEDEQFANTNKFYWGRGYDPIKKRRILLPASMLYINFRFLHTDEPDLLEVSTNGVATFTDQETALVRAIYEALERDGLLMYWLNTIAPQRILVKGYSDTIDDALDKLVQQGYEVYFLDCKTEFQIPIIVSVLIDTTTGGVAVHAAANLHVETMISKLLDDHMRWSTESSFQRPTVEPSAISTMNEREQFWCGGYMREQIDFFIKGPEISFDDYCTQFEQRNNLDELNILTNALRQAGASIYYYVYPCEVAKGAGLTVVRAIIPELIPIYFSEFRKHLNVPRIFTFKERMGYSKTPSSMEILNPIPHPFI